MKLIPLTKGQFAKVDDEDYEWLSQWKWYTHDVKEGKWYADRMEGVRETRKHIYMHREILNASLEMQVDHKDGDGLNNCRDNLRICTKSQNMANRGKTKFNTSNYKGVYKNGKGWSACLYKDNKMFHIGTFPSPEQAAVAYDKLACELFGEFAKTNF